VSNTPQYCLSLKPPHSKIVWLPNQQLQFCSHSSHSDAFEGEGAQHIDLVATIAARDAQMVRHEPRALHSAAAIRAGGIRQIAELASIGICRRLCGMG